MRQRRAKRDRRRHETSSHQVSSNRSSATIGELLEQDAILAATASALSAARSAEITCATEADIARAVRERHTQRRKSLEKLTFESSKSKPSSVPPNKSEKSKNFHFNAHYERKQNDDPDSHRRPNGDRCPS